LIIKSAASGWSLAQEWQFLWCEAMTEYCGSDFGAFIIRFAFRDVIFPYNFTAPGYFQ
jgi:hypothetical protein